MTTLTIENAAIVGKISAKETQQTTQADYTAFFNNHPEYAVYRRKYFDNTRQFIADKTKTHNTILGRGDKFISQDGNSIITVKKNSITAESKNGKPDIVAMLDLAEANGWKQIKLPKFIGKGSQEFRQEMWLEASKRGFEVQGYKPTNAEKQQLAAALNKEKEKPLEIRPKEPENVSGSLNKDANQKDKVLLANSLSKEEARKKVLSAYAEFVPVDSPAFNDIEKVVEKHLANIYQSGGAVTMNQAKNLSGNIANHQTQARQDFVRAAAAEQDKTQQAIRNHNMAVAKETTHKPQQELGGRE